MKSLIRRFTLIQILLLSLCILNSYGQERQDEQRQQLDIKMLGQSERLSKIIGWSKIESSEGNFWKQADVNSNISYLPCCPHEGFEFLQMFNFQLEGQSYYLLMIKYNDIPKRYFAFTGSSLTKLKETINRKDGRSYFAIDIKYCTFLTPVKIKRNSPDKADDPNEIIRNKELIRLLLLGKGSNLLSNWCENDSVFLMNSQVLKGKSIVRFNLLPWRNTTDEIRPLSDNYFEIEKQDFEKLFRFTPYEDEKDFITKGEEKLKLKDYTGALSEYTKAIKLNPDNWSCYNRCGQAKDGLKDYSGAIADYTIAIDILSKENLSDGSIKQSIGIIYGNRATSKYNLKDFDGAIDDYTKAINNKPDNVPTYYYYRGSVKLELKDFSGAESDFSEAIRKLPFGTEYNIEKATYFLARGNAKVALKDYAPKNLETLSAPERLALKRNGNGAISDFSESIELYPKNMLAYNMRAIAKNIIQDYNGAMSDCNMAIEIDPKFAAAYCNRAKVKNNLQDYHGAIIDCDKALEINPNIGAAFNHRGLAKIKSGQKEDGCIDLNKAAESGYPDSNELLKQYCK